MRPTILRAGESRVVVNRQFSSVPMDYRFYAESTADTSTAPIGTIEIVRRKVLASEMPEIRDLLAENIVSAGFWDTFVKVTVHAKEDLTLSGKPISPGNSDRISARKSSSKLPVLLLARINHR